MKNHLKSYSLIMIILSFLLLMGCEHTVRGAGQDIQEDTTAVHNAMNS